MARAENRRRRRRWWIAALAVLAAGMVAVAIVAVPILTHEDQGGSGQVEAADYWPTAVTAVGDDGRERSFEVTAAEPGTTLDTSALSPGARIVVEGSGYDGARGIYVAICRIPEEGEKPGPCIGGVPEQAAADEGVVGAVEYAPSSWINDDWAWRLFGARSWDDPEAGTFTAYLEVGDPVSDALDCTVERCGIFTRNDHTAAADRVQDLYVPVGFADRG
jgi:hypothetical protein